ncbi:hypothetical protein WJX81_006232 [Elliptochloris bilobata]|uniref:Cystinosin n=1 Tax=Elliptochloris bilobata TaxID=381761 RepID=A0AAW1QTJ8_9CHLO
MRTLLSNDGAGVLLVMVLVLGVTLGLAMPADSEMPYPWNRIGEVAGWSYVMAWSLSFYPQFVFNWRRKSVVGFSLDLALLNPAGFLCLLAYYGSFTFSPSIRRAYRDQHGTDSSVRINDVFFAGHASCIALATLAQCAVYERGAQRVHEHTRLAFAIMVPLTVTYAAATWLLPADISVISFLYYLSMIKIAVTLAKYVPQVLLNRERRSTSGFSIAQVLCDFTGGSLSLFQLCLEATVMRDISLITGDPVKFGLGFVSLFYDILLMIQHYIIYAQPRSAGKAHAPLRCKAASDAEHGEAASNGFSEDHEAPLLEAAALQPASSRVIAHTADRSAANAAV